MYLLNRTFDCCESVNGKIQITDFYKINKQSCIIKITVSISNCFH